MEGMADADNLSCFFCFVLFFFSLRTSSVRALPLSLSKLECVRYQAQLLDPSEMLRFSKPSRAF